MHVRSWLHNAEGPVHILGLYKLKLSHKTRQVRHPCASWLCTINPESKYEQIQSTLPVPFLANASCIWCFMKVSHVSAIFGSSPVLRGLRYNNTTRKNCAATMEVAKYTFFFLLFQSPYPVLDWICPSSSSSITVGDSQTV